MNASTAASPPLPLRHCYWVVPGLLLAGEHPGGPTRDKTKDRLKKLLEAGIECFVDLTKPTELPRYDTFLPFYVEYARKAIKDHGLPASRDQMVEILEYVANSMRAGRPVYVHCRAGIGRTGTVVGCLLVERGFAGVGALDELNRLWQQSKRSRTWAFIPETEAQSNYIRDWQPSMASGGFEPNANAAAVAGVGPISASGGQGHSALTVADVQARAAKQPPGGAAQARAASQNIVTAKARKGSAPAASAYSGGGLAAAATQARAAVDAGLTPPPRRTATDGHSPRAPRRSQTPETGSSSPGGSATRDERGWPSRDLTVEPTTRQSESLSLHPAAELARRELESLQQITQQARRDLESLRSAAVGTFPNRMDGAPEVHSKEAAPALAGTRRATELGSPVVAPELPVARRPPESEEPRGPERPKAPEPHGPEMPKAPEPRGPERPKAPEPRGPERPKAPEPRDIFPAQAQQPRVDPDPLLDSDTLMAARALRERFVGALLGLAVGDAVAAATQYRRPGTFSPVGDMLGGGPFDLPRGAWSDDTAMTLCLAESLLACEGFDARDQVQRYTRWQQEAYLSSTGQCLGITASTARSLAIAKWRRVVFPGSHDPEQLDPEPLSRLAPIPLYYFSSIETILQQAAESARTTCQAPAVLDACRMLGGAIHAALSGQPKERILAEAGGPAKPPILVTNTVTTALGAAVWAFASTDNFRDAILRAANVGGSSDVVASVCGQLAGAHYGFSAIPPSWRNGLMHKELIESYADRLLAHVLVCLSGAPSSGG